MKKEVQVLTVILLLSLTVYSQNREAKNGSHERIVSQHIQGQQLITDNFFGINASLAETPQFRSSLRDWDVLVQSSYHKWDSDIAGWECREKTIYSYDEDYTYWTVIERQKADGSIPIQKREYYYYLGDDNYVDEIRTSDYDSSEWVLKRQTLYYYDNVSNNLMQQLTKTWDGEEYENYSKTTYLYDDNRITSYLIQYWIEDIWVDNTNKIYNYDQNNNLYRIDGQSWDSEANIWVQFSKLFFTYDPETNNLYTMESQYWDDDENYWEKSLKQFFTYDENNYNRIKVVYKKWDDEELFWDKSSMSKYYHLPAGSEQLKYNNTGLDKSIEDFQTTEDDLVINEEKRPGRDMSLYGIEVMIDTLLHTSVGDLEITLSHNGISDTLLYREGGDGDNFIGTKLTDKGVIYITEGVAPFIGSYKPKNSLSRFLGTDPTGTWTLSIYDGVAGNTGTLKAWGLNFIYAPNSSTGDEHSETLSVKLFPNPAGSVVNLQFSAGIQHSIVVELYDLNGRKLLEKHIPAGSEEVKINVSGLGNGVYFCRLILENKSVTKKLIIQK